MTTLPEPHFIARDPEQILAECIAFFEEKTGKPLLPTQDERILIDLIAYRETLIRIAIQEAAKQNLRAFARYPMIDYLAELIGTARLEAQAARTTLRFAFAEPPGVVTLIEAGKRVKTNDGQFEFVTLADGVISTVSTHVDVTAEATAVGPTANGYGPGQVNAPVEPLPEGMTVGNVTTTAGGAHEEETEALRERIPEAAHTLSSAGPEGAYRAFALRASPAVLDAAEEGGEGLVTVAVLARAPDSAEFPDSPTGQMPTPEIVGLVHDAINHEDVAVLTDTVEAVACVERPYQIEAALYLKRNAPISQTLARAERAAHLYAREISARLGQTPVPDAVIAALRVPGVWHVDLAEPAFEAIAWNEWAHCTSVVVTLAGFEGDL